MIRAPHEIPVPGPAADFAAALSAQLPVIETARLRLRAPLLTDFDAWAEIFCGPAGPHLGGPYTRDEAFAEFATTVGTWLLRGHGLWTVEPKAGGEVLGFALVGFEPGDQEPELGYLLRPAAEGQGYATEAALALRDHAFSRLGMQHLLSYIHPENAGSVRVVQRLGATRAADHDDAQVWVHRPAGSAQQSDTVQMSKRGD